MKCEQKNILENGLIRFTQPSYFNDPFEALPTIEQMVSNDLIEALYTSFSNDSLFNDLISKIDNKESRKNLELARKKFIDSDIHHKLLFHDKLSGNTEYDLSCEFQKYWDSQVGILCLAENDSNLTMWSHYSENHTGFLIGFNSQKDITDSKQCLIKPNRIQYVCKRPHITLLDSKNKRGDQYLYQIINTFLYTKSKD